MPAIEITRQPIALTQEMMYFYLALGLYPCKMAVSRQPGCSAGV